MFGFLKRSLYDSRAFFISFCFFIVLFSFLSAAVSTKDTMATTRYVEDYLQGKDNDFQGDDFYSKILVRTTKNKHVGAYSSARYNFSLSSVFGDIYISKRFLSCHNAMFTNPSEKNIRDTMYILGRKNTLVNNLFFADILKVIHIPSYRNNILNYCGDDQLITTNAVYYTLKV